MPRRQPVFGRKGLLSPSKRGVRWRRRSAPTDRGRPSPRLAADPGWPL